MVKFVRLDRRGRVGIELKTVSPWCGATGNCELYIFDGKTADLLVKDGGWDLAFDKPLTMGFMTFMRGATPVPNQGHGTSMNSMARFTGE